MSSRYTLIYAVTALQNSSYSFPVTISVPPNPSSNSCSSFISYTIILLLCYSYRIPTVRRYLLSLLSLPPIAHPTFVIPQQPDFVITLHIFSFFSPYLSLVSSELFFFSFPSFSLISQAPFFRLAVLCSGSHIFPLFLVLDQVFWAGIACLVRFSLLKRLRPRGSVVPNSSLCDRRNSLRSHIMFLSSYVCLFVCVIG